MSVMENSTLKYLETISLEMNTQVLPLYIHTDIRLTGKTVEFLQESLSKYFPSADIGIILTLLKSSRPLPISEIATQIQAKNTRYVYEQIKRLMERKIIIEIHNDPAYARIFYTSQSLMRNFFHNITVSNQLTELRVHNIFQNVDELQMTTRINNSTLNDSVDCSSGMQDHLFFQQGEALREAGQHQEALKIYSKVMNGVPQDEPLWKHSFYKMADGEYIYDRLENSKRLLEENLEVKSGTPLLPTIHRGLGHVFLMKKDYSLALINYKLSLSYAMKNNDLKCIVEACNSVAESLISLDPMEALKYINFGRSLSSITPGLQVEHGKSFYIQADLLNRLGKFTEAIKYAQMSQIFLKTRYASGLARAESACAVALVAQKKFKESLPLITSVCEYYEKEKIYKSLKLQSNELLERVTCRI
jgi:tetratricopeptide (TPR) repeat protein